MLISFKKLSTVVPSTDAELFFTCKVYGVRRIDLAYRVSILSQGVKAQFLNEMVGSPKMC